jgi:hypothetical protein
MDSIFQTNIPTSDHHDGEARTNHRGCERINVKDKMTATDYNQILPEIHAIIEQYGGVRLPFHLTEFKGEAMSAWGPDFRFGKEFGKKILRSTIIGDKVWEKWLAG